MTSFILNLRTVVSALTALVLIIAVKPTHAQTIDWDGSDSTAWALGDNWAGGTAPADDLITNIARFNSAIYTNQPNAGTRSVNGIIIGASSGDLTIAGTSLTIGDGGITSDKSSGSLIVSSSIALGANQTWAVGTNAFAALRITGIVSGSDRILNLSGGTAAGIVRMEATNTYSGTTNIQGTLVEGRNAAAFGTSSINVANGSELFLRDFAPVFENAVTLNGGTGLPGSGNRVALRFDGRTLNGTLTLAASTNSAIGVNNTLGTISGQITGSGALTVGTAQMSANTTGATNAVTLSGTTNNWTGGLTIRGDALTANLTDRASRYQTVALGASGVITDTNSIIFGADANETATNSRLNLNGFNETVDLLSSFANGFGVIFNGANATTSTLTLGGGSASSATFSGVIRNDNPSLAGTGTMALTKVGAGTQILSGTNTYTGATMVNAGTLLVNGNMSAATGDVTVASGATLGGDGTLGGSMTVSGIIAPGNSIGTLSILDSVIWNGSAGNEWKFELGMGAVSLAAASASTDSDLLNITGNFVRSGSLWEFNFEDTGSEGWFKLVDWNGTTDFDVSNFTYTNLAGGLTGSFTLDASTSALYVNVIPEPSTGLLLAMGAITLAMTIRRRSDA